MHLAGSCHCGAVKFRVKSIHPYPFNLCYCSICRKTAGGGGFAINLSGRFSSLQVTGEDNLNVYQARIGNNDSTAGELSPARRNFCRHCGSALWVWDPRWPELVHPFASAIDSELPQPPQRTHLMLGSKPDWVIAQFGADDQQFHEYPQESVAEWHQRLGLEDPGAAGDDRD